jgi:hypothetical protein
MKTQATGLGESGRSFGEQVLAGAEGIGLGSPMPMRLAIRPFPRGCRTAR